MNQESKIMPLTGGNLSAASKSESFDPEMIIREIGIEPHSIWKKGEIVEGHKTPPVTSGWIMYSEAHDESYFPEHIEDILEKIRPVKSKFKAVFAEMEDCRLTLGLRLGLYEEVPVAYSTVPARLLGELADLGIDLEFTAIRETDVERLFGKDQDDKTGR